MSDEAALLRAVAADAGDDTPRLVYADWLDEHEAPVQAEFVRAQCRLAAGSAADPDYPDLLERYAEVTARFAPAVRLTAPPLPPGFVHTRVGREDEHFRRGFLHTAHAEWCAGPEYSRRVPAEDELDRVCAGLLDLVTHTTVRHLILRTMPPDALARVLTSPGADRLTGLTAQPVEWGADAGDRLVAVVAAGRTANLERLALECGATVAGLGPLARVPPRLRSVQLPALSGAAADVPALARAGWFRGLRDARLWNADRAVQEPLLAALAGLPHLDALDLRLGHRGWLRPLGARDGFPALAKLAVQSWVAADRVAERLARGRFPRLADLTFPGLRDDSFAPLLGAPWFARLRVLDVSNGYLKGRSAVALSRSDAAAGLRVLRAGHNPLTQAGRAALTNGDRFPALTTLDLRTGGFAMRPELAARLAAGLSLPQVRHLDLGGLPLGDAGAKALAANPAVAGVTRLGLANCRIGDRGLSALARSPHLRGVVELDLANNTLKRAAALADPDLFPRLALAVLVGNPLAPVAGERLRRARGWLIHAGLP